MIAPVKSNGAIPPLITFYVRRITSVVVMITIEREEKGDSFLFLEEKISGDGGFKATDSFDRALPRVRRSMGGRRGRRGGRRPTPGAGFVAETGIGAA